MSEFLFVLLLIGFGMLTGPFFLFVNYLCFSSIKRILDRERIGTKKISSPHLFGFTLAAVVSGGLFLLIVVMVAKWANGYPEWANKKNLYWVGVLSGFVVMKFIDIYKKRKQKPIF